MASRSQSPCPCRPGGPIPRVPLARHRGRGGGLDFVYNNQGGIACPQGRQARSESSCASNTMGMTAQAAPSIEARSLFNNMVAHAQPLGEDRNTLHIDVGNLLVVGCQRTRQGLDAGASAEIGELLVEHWIKPAPSGGWFLG